MTPKEVLAACRRDEIRAVDLRFMDFPGLQKHFTIPVESLTEASFEEGFGFDASSMRGWQAINESDMLLIPVADTAMVDPFMKGTLALTCNIVDPITRADYDRDPRNIARKAEAYMRSTGVADVAQFGPEAEFFVFDRVRFDQTTNEGYYHVDSIEGEWNRGRGDGDGSRSRGGGVEVGGSFSAGHRVRRREGYFPMPPTDTLQDLRTEIMLTLQACGVPVEAQHHEVATGGQCEVDLSYGSLVMTADRVLRQKYIIKNIAARHGKTVTFMPKPLWNDNGSGLHLHFSLWKDNETLFAGSGYGGLSETAMFAMGGILKHAAALFAFCCPTTNSYKRFVPGFDAPVNLTYSFRNRSAAIRIPVHNSSPASKRFEFRCPDPSCNPYLAMSAILMAALDGVQNRIDPGPPLDKDIYDLAPEELDEFPAVPGSLEEALSALETDHAFLLKGDVFTEDVINTWIWFKRTQECAAVRERPHPWEFAMYYDV
ncbi:MAG: type I glutamate--ammonia ligase [Planctomycetaceae bacterium]